MNRLSASPSLLRRTRTSSSLLSTADFRFSLRELLLFMLACAAFSGLGHVVYRKSQPFRATHVAEHFVDGFGNEIAEIAEALSGEGAALSFAGLSNEKQLAGTGGKEQICLNWSSDLRMSWEKGYRLRKELTRRMIVRIKQGQPGDFVSSLENFVDNVGALGDTQEDMPPQIDSRYLGCRTIGMAGDYYEDEIQYRSGDIYGELRICLVGIDGKPLRLMAALHEWRPR
jgi:hypothetical protein